LNKIRPPVTNLMKKSQTYNVRRLFVHGSCGLQIIRAPIMRSADFPCADQPICRLSVRGSSVLRIIHARNIRSADYPCTVVSC